MPMGLDLRVPVAPPIHARTRAPDSSITALPAGFPTITGIAVLTSIGPAARRRGLNRD